jgi:Ca2+-binding RTX toxin-like protein
MVRSFVSFNLGATPRVENLALIGTADTTGTGTNIANVITGNNGKNILRGLAGNDTLSGNGGDDRLEGGAGADVLRGGAGNDVYRIDAGDTVIEFSASGPGDRIECPVGFSLMTAPQVEHLTLLGSASVSGTGNNLGNTIIGNAAVNTLAGNGGNDVLIGGAGGDTLVGGLGADIFRYHSLLDSPGAFSPAISDTVDLVPGSGDKIDLRAIDANVTNGPGNDVFIFVGPAFFTGPGQVRYSVIDAVFTKIVTIEANVDNTVGSPDFSVQFTVFTSGPAVLSAGDFML